jgi:hypothetical protein
MKKIILGVCLFSLSILIVHLTSCSKVQEEFQGLGSPTKLVSFMLSDDTVNIYNYVWLSNDKLVRPRDSGISMSVVAAFTDSVTGQIATMSGVSINNRTLIPNSSHSYSFEYSDSANNAIQEGKNLYGTNVSIKITGSSAADTATRMIYMPKRVFNTSVGFPSGTVDISQPLVLNWLTDPSCSWGNVGIQIYYNAAASRFMHDPTLPATDTTFTYIVPDNGSYTLSTTQLQKFRVNSLITITLGRGSTLSAVLPVSKKRIFYYATSTMKSSPITLTAPNTNYINATPGRVYLSNVGGVTDGIVYANTTQTKTHIAFTAAINCLVQIAAGTSSKLFLKVNGTTVQTLTCTAGFTGNRTFTSRTYSASDVITVDWETDN